MARRRDDFDDTLVPQVGDEPRRGRRGAGTKPTGRHPHNRLTDVVARQAAPGRYADGNGCICSYATPARVTGCSAITIHGSRRELGLGPYPVVSLANARDAALANRRTVCDGVIPPWRPSGRRVPPSVAFTRPLLTSAGRAGTRNPPRPPGAVASRSTSSPSSVTSRSLPSPLTTFAALSFPFGVGATASATPCGRTSSTSCAMRSSRGIASTIRLLISNWSCRRSGRRPLTGRASPIPTLPRRWPSGRRSR